MTFSPNSPSTGDSLGSTRDVIRTNFQQIDVVNSVNHIAFNESDKGKHKFMQMPEQGSNPTTAVNEGALVVRVGTNPAEANLFFRGESDGALYQLTRSDQTNQARFGMSSSTLPNGWTFLPGGLILQWGSVTNPGTSGTVTFATSNINFPTAVLNIQLQLYHNSSANESATIKQDDPPTTSLFKYRTTSSSANTVMKWTAIGY